MPAVPMIKMEDCKDGFLYFIEARNARIGIYNQKALGFTISREKFGSNFLFTEYHWDIGDVKPEEKGFGTARPMKEIGPTSMSFLPEMNDDEKLKFLNEQAVRLKEERDSYSCSDPIPVYSGPTFDWRKKKDQSPT